MSIESVMPSNHLILCCPLLHRLQSFLASGSFPMSQFFASVGQSIGVSASVLQINIQGWFPLGLTRWISLLVQETLKSLLQHHSSKASILWCSAFFMVQLSHPYMITGKTIALTILTFIGKVMFLLFNVLSRFAIVFFQGASILESESRSVVSNSLQPHGLYSLWNSLGQNTGVGNLSLLQGIFPTQGSNPGLLHCRQILYQLSHKGSPRILEWVAYPFCRGSSPPRNQTRVSCIAGGFFTNWAID